MPNVQALRTDLISVLENLRPHFAEADFLIGAIREWLDETSLLELADLLESAALAVDGKAMEDKLSSAILLVRERREIEIKERSEESTEAKNVLESDFL